MITAETISDVLGSSEANVKANWPIIVSALIATGIDSTMVRIAAAATVMVETGSFRPVVEKLAKEDKQPDLYKSQMRYFTFIGRGFVQITWEKNYQIFGGLIGVDLIEHPEAAMEPGNAARILAEYFKRTGVHNAANVQDWRKVRRLVNGGYNGWEPFIGYVQALMEASGAQ